MWKWPFPHSRIGHFQCPKRKLKTTCCGANSVYLDQGVNILQMFSSLLPLSWCIQVQNGKTPYFTSSLIIVVRLRKRCLVLLSNRWSRSFNCISYIIIVDQNDCWCWFQLSGPVVHLSRPGSHRKASRPLFQRQRQRQRQSCASLISQGLEATAKLLALSSTFLSNTEPYLVHIRYWTIE